MTSFSPADEHMSWAVDQLGCNGAVSVTRLRDGGAPWLLECADADGTTRRAVLRVGETTPDSGREITGMRVAADAGLPVPRVLARRQDGSSTLLLIEYVDGSSHLPLEADARRLRAAGAVAARIFAIGAHDDLPLVVHPIPTVDFDELRVQADPQPLLDEAQRRIEAGTPDDPVGFTHGDLWSGNLLWRGARVASVLDWDCTGNGAAGVDLGSLRCDAAMCFGDGAEDVVLAGWQDEAARAADSIAYWDAVAALSTPPDISWFSAAISGMTGRADLTTAVLRRRRDTFLAVALDRLG